VNTGEDAYATSPEGHRYRVRFDPVSNVTVGVASAMERGEKGRPAGALELSAGLGYRSASERGEGKDRVAWTVDHRVLSGWVQPVPRASGLPSLDAAAYSVSMLRHDASPSIVLPTSPPVGIPFPFDVGFEGEAGRVTVLPYSAQAMRGAPEVIRVGVVSTSLLLDPWRSGVTGRSFTLGVGAHYEIDAARGAATIHRIAPMTAGSVRFRYEARDGLTHVAVGGDVIPHWSSEGAWRFMARSSLHLERTLIALSDEPMSAVVDGGYRLDPSTPGSPPLSDFRVSLGLALHFCLK
jgi:hypothetical protein